MILKAFLITGGTDESKQEEYTKLIRKHVSLMHANYKGENELAVIFTANGDDFNGMAFEEAKEFASRASGRGTQFEIINLPEFQLDR